jgi:hypothetical protein
LPVCGESFTRKARPTISGGSFGCMEARRLRVDEARSRPEKRWWVCEEESIFCHLKVLINAVIGRVASRDLISTNSKCRRGSTKHKILQTLFASML